MQAEGHGAALRIDFLRVRLSSDAMAYRVAADAVLVAHFAFVLFAALGALLVLRWPRLAWLHLPAAAWAAVVELSGWVCPLTPLEQALHRRAGDAGYAGDFLEHYVVSLLYPEGLTRDVQIALGAMVVAMNVAIYIFAFVRKRARR